MKKLYITLLVVILIGIVFDHNRNALSYTSGAPTGYTNAPGETSCSEWACHNGPQNSCGGNKTLTSMEDITNGYIPGSPYNIMPYAFQSGFPRVGFQTVALLSNGQGAGSVTIYSAKTQMNPAGGMEYVTHTNSGNLNVGLHDWMYEWTAPPQGSGTVTIYAAFIISNNSGTADNGDCIYTDSLVIPENTTGIFESGDKMEWRAFPNPVSNSFSVRLPCPQTGLKNYDVIIYNVFGEIIFKGSSGSFPVSRLDLTGKPSGIYFVRIDSGGENQILKVVKI